MIQLVSLRLVLLTGLLISAVLTSADLQARKIECHAGQHLRIIETRYPPKDSGVACSVMYHKPTEKVASKELWSARNDAEYCGNKAWLLANKLEDGGWKCASIYEATQGNHPLRVSRTTHGRPISNAPTSPLAFKEFLAGEFGVSFETHEDYYYNEDAQGCTANSCKRFFDYRNQLVGAPVAFFGYRVSPAIKLWMDLECDGGQCWGRLYKEEAGKDIEKLQLPESETGVAFNIFLKSTSEGFPDLWLPITHSASNVVEVKLFRYQGGSYRTLAHLLAKPKPTSELPITPTQEQALHAGVVTLTANYADDNVELVYQTTDIDYEGLLFDPSRK